MKKDRKFVAAIGFLIVGLVLLHSTVEAVSVYASIPVPFPFPLMVFDSVGAILAIYILLLLSPFMLAGALLLECRKK